MDDTQKILIPLIRKHLASVIANDIMSVQPMSNPFDVELWPYHTEIRYNQCIPAREWCLETLDNDEWISKVQFFAFKNEQAYSWFMLRWS